ncbi:MAG: tRNA (N6-isopentenyl adenosine(37)-C2)-methylthiotransferase MiaB [Aggregatilineales bacterium]
MKYHIWTLGCQMNTADSQRLASELERLGHRAALEPDSADILVVNTCVVRQSAEEKGLGRLYALERVKRQHPHKIVGVMGCMVGVRDPLRLRQKLPFVDVFMPPSEPGPMIAFLRDRAAEAEAVSEEAQARQKRDAIQDGDLILPEHEQGSLVSAHVPVVYGCSHACSFCIIPFRRGVERSRSVGEIVAHVRSLALQGVKEITLLGQIVDRYGKDIPDGPDLADLLRIVHDVAEETGLQRIRFLTSHPNWMTDKLLDTVAELPRVMPHIEVPVQAGDDEVLARMKRGYTVDQYRRLIANIRARIPDVAINTDIIVGFPGETDQQFQRTYDLLAELRLDKAHLARYSPRPHTLSARTMPDDVPDDVKRQRHQALEDLQAKIVAQINQRYLGASVPVLVEDRHKGRWRGRTPQNKLVFFDDSADWRGQIVEVEITWTGPWSMQGRLPVVERAAPLAILPAS